MASFSAIKQASEEVQWIFVLVSKPLEAPNSCEFSYLCLTKSPKENGGFAPSTRKKSAKISTLSVSSCSEQSLKILCPVLQLQVKSFKDKYVFFQNLRDVSVLLAPICWRRVLVLQLVSFLLKDFIEIATKVWLFVTSSPFSYPQKEATKIKKTNVKHKTSRQF